MYRKLLLALALVFAFPASAQAQVVVQDSTLRVHVTGHVKRPGVYTLPVGSRGADAVQAAGGVAKGAARDALNLASILEDGQRLDVPAQPSASTIRAASQPQASIGGGSRRKRGPASSPTVNHKVSVNKASIEEFDALPGIGRTLAEEIIRYRNQKGRFRTLDELKEVSGIGERRFERLAPRLSL